MVWEWEGKVIRCGVVKGMKLFIFNDKIIGYDFNVQEIYKVMLYVKFGGVGMQI